MDKFLQLLKENPKKAIVVALAMLVLAVGSYVISTDDNNKDCPPATDKVTISDDNAGNCDAPMISYDDEKK